MLIFHAAHTPLKQEVTAMEAEKPLSVNSVVMAATTTGAWLSAPRLAGNRALFCHHTVTPYFAASPTEAKMLPGGSTSKSTLPVDQSVTNVSVCTGTETDDPMVAVVLLFLPLTSSLPGWHTRGIRSIKDKSCQAMNIFVRAIRGKEIC